MHKVECRKCGKEYQKNDKVAVEQEPICYTCALRALCNGCSPEEGDFNTASLQSGEISDKELSWLEEDLRAVESGRSVKEKYCHTDWDDDEVRLNYEEMYSYQENEDLDSEEN